MCDSTCTTVLPGSGLDRTIPPLPAAGLVPAEQLVLPAPSPHSVLSSSAFSVSALQIPDKQYVLTALAARAKLRAWHDVDALLTTKVSGKTFLGGGSKHLLFPGYVHLVRGR